MCKLVCELISVSVALTVSRLSFVSACVRRVGLTQAVDRTASHMSCVLSPMLVVAEPVSSFPPKLKNYSLRTVTLHMPYDVFIITLYKDDDSVFVIGLA